MVVQPFTYQNPVFPESFPDPFVLKHCGEYFAYCTGFAKDGLAVGIAHSADLINWTYLGGALQPISSEPPYYWAPEVVYSNGRFYMYYSCGNETLMEIRVAVSDRPDGGFVDAGFRLTREDFAIDAHVFTDDDGERYMFYATDFLTYSHIGTGTVVDRMLDWFRLAGEPRPVSRAAYDWQVYDPHRLEKGGVRWHTVEGPTVFKYKRKYFEMFSGGNWQNSSYGVAYAVSERIQDPGEWLQSIDGISELPVLRTIPGKVLGPGHNSAAIGPNGRELYCVYHSWVEGERVMAIDRMGFAGDRLWVKGPTSTPEMAPLRPDANTESTGWQFFGDWERGPNLLRPEEGPARAEHSTGGSCFLVELSFRASPGSDAVITFGGSFGELPVFELSFSTATGEITFADKRISAASSPEPPDYSAFQRLRIEADGTFIRFLLNDLPLDVVSDLELACDRFSIETTSAEIEICGFSLTSGYENRFERAGYEPVAAGWKTSGPVRLNVVGEELRLASDDAEAVAWKGDSTGAFEFAVTLRSVSARQGETSFGFALIDSSGEIFRRFVIEKLRDGPVLSDNRNGVHLPLPSTYREQSHRQFRFIRVGTRLRIESEASSLGELELDSQPAMIGILTKGVEVAVEMVRWTPLRYLEDDPI